ncbi:hypothetical protein AYI70_g621, partial [Smittium culicis]
MSINNFLSSGTQNYGNEDLVGIDAGSDAGMIDRRDSRSSNSRGRDSGRGNSSRQHAYDDVDVELGGFGIESSHVPTNINYDAKNHGRNGKMQASSTKVFQCSRFPFDIYISGKYESNHGSDKPNVRGSRTTGNIGGDMGRRSSFGEDTVVSHTSTSTAGSPISNVISAHSAGYNSFEQNEEFERTSRFDFGKMFRDITHLNHG